MFNDFFTEYAMAWQLETRKQMWGVYGPCTCDRPGYNRKEPDNCKWCKKPFRLIYIERNKSGVTFEQVEQKYQEGLRQQAEAERLELARIREESGEDEFVWLRSLGMDQGKSDSGS